ncbi:hypothetical protein MTO96_038254 [Rhipicephalus appendiculatus]
MAGAAYVVLGPADRVAAVGRFSLSRATGAFCAETLALAEAISWLHNHPTIQDVRAYTDCLSLLQALSSRKNTDPRIANTKRALCHIGSSSPIRLYHVPGHAGVFGNEIADYIASRAARQGDPRPLQWSLRNVRAVYRTEFYRRWALQWSREDGDTALYKWVPDPRELPDYFPPNKALVTLLTGNGRFHSYFHRFNLLRDPRCFCGAPCDSVEHYLLDCQATRHLAEQLQPKATRDNACYPNILRHPRNRAIFD